MTTAKPSNIDEYIAGFPKEVQAILEQVRETIKKTAPDAEEAISYGIPTFRLHKTYLVYFAGFKNHIGFYPTPTGSVAFKEELSGYKTGKGSVQFPLDKPMPLDLISRIVQFRIGQILEKTVKKKPDPANSFLSKLNAPARRALEQLNINALDQLAAYTETEILSLHGMGPHTISILKNALKNKNLSFKTN